MNNQEYFDTKFVTLPAEATVGDAMAQLRERKAGDTWHIFVELGGGRLGVIWVKTLREWFKRLGARLFDLRLVDLPLVVPARAIPVAQATIGSPSRLYELSLKEPSRVFVITDEGHPVGRTRMVSKDVFPGSTMGQLYGDYITQAPDARAEWRPAGVEPPTCPHCGHQGFYRYHVEDGTLACSACNQVIPER